MYLLKVFCEALGVFLAALSGFSMGLIGFCAALSRFRKACSQCRRCVGECRIRSVLLVAFMASGLLACTAVSEQVQSVLKPIHVTVTQPQTANFVVQGLVQDGVFTVGIEGPATDFYGNLYAVNYAVEGSIGVVRTGGNHKGKTSKFLQLPQGSVGNGIRFNRQGMMFVADYSGHNILRINPRTQRVSVFAHNKNMNQPNDLAISAKDLLYASDPNWAEGSGKLWRIDAVGDGTEGIISLLEENMGTSNGIEISADEKRLYVNESLQRKIWVYDLLSSGGVTNKRLFYQFEKYGLDGMRCDIEGNIFVARYGAGEVAMLSAEGKLIRTVKLIGRYPTNLAFGGIDGRDIYVTMQKRGAIETFRVPHAGRSYKLWQASAPVETQ